jgi:hypothetical protein
MTVIQATISRACDTGRNVMRRAGSLRTNQKSVWLEVPTRMAILHESADRISHNANEDF